MPKIYSLIIPIFFFYLMLFAAPALGQPRFVFLSVQDGINEQLTNDTVELMQVVAASLQVDIEFVRVKKGDLKSVGMKLINAKIKPDMLIMPYHKGVTTKLLKAADANQLNVFLIDALIPAEEKAKLGKPRYRFSRWLASIATNELEAGYQLMDSLIRQAQRSRAYDSEGKINVLAISPDHNGLAFSLRQQGMLRRIQQSPKVKVQAVSVLADDLHSAKQSTLGLLPQYPQTRVIWSASDELALAAIDAIEAIGQRPSVDIINGGVISSNVAPATITQGKMNIAWTGHYLQTIAALVLLTDYYYGYDFARELGLQVKTPVFAITRSNIVSYKHLLNKQAWRQLDFKRLSKHYNPNIQRYNFSPEMLASLRR